MEGPGFIIGNIAKGQDLWDRRDEIASIWKALEKSSVLLKAPRRFGKTSIMYNLYKNPKSDYKIIFEDTEGMRDPQDFIARLMAELLSSKTFMTTIGKWFKRNLPSIEEIGLSLGSSEEISVADIRLKIKESIGKDWQAKGFEFISQIKEYQGRILFILDELPLLVQNILRKDGEKAAYDFLHWFRAIRQMPELSQVRWLVGGSIGIEHILAKVKTGTKVINDFHILRVEPFSEEEGINYIKALLRNEGQMSRVQRSVVDEIMEVIGAPVPYFIQILIYESLNEMRRRRKKTIDKETIQKAYREGVLGPASRTYFEHYFTRLKDYYDGHIERVAKRLILEVARQKRVKKTELFKLFRQISKGELSDETFSYLMTDVENDFYVSYNANDRCYSFATNVLRDWWLRYYDLVEE